MILNRKLYVSFMVGRELMNVVTRVLFLLFFVITIHVKVLEQINLFCVNPYVYIVRCYYSTNRVFVDLFFTEVRNPYNVF